MKAFKAASDMSSRCSSAAEIFIAACARVEGDSSYEERKAARTTEIEALKSELDALKQRIDQEGKVGGARRMCAAISKPTT